MMNNANSNTSAKIRVALIPDDEGTIPAGERLCAEPVNGRDDLYMLHNNAFGASLRVGDVVRTELDGCGKPQVVGIEALSRGPVTTVEFPLDGDPHEIGRLADTWKKLGAEFSEGNGLYFITAWVAQATPQSVCEVIQATAPRWRLLDVCTAPIRSTRLMREVDFKLDTRTPAQIAAAMEEWPEDSDGIDFDDLD